MAWDIDLSVVCEFQEAVEWYGIHESKWYVNRIRENLSSDAILDYKNNRCIQKLYELLESSDTLDLRSCCLHYITNYAVDLDDHLVYSGIFKILAIKNNFFASKIGNGIFGELSNYDIILLQVSHRISLFRSHRTAWNDLLKFFEIVVFKDMPRDITIICYNPSDP